MTTHERERPNYDYTAELPIQREPSDRQQLTERKSSFVMSPSYLFLLRGFVKKYPYVVLTADNFGFRGMSGLDNYPQAMTMAKDNHDRSSSETARRDGWWSAVFQEAKAGPSDLQEVNFETEGPSRENGMLQTIIESSGRLGLPHFVVAISKDSKGQISFRLLQRSKDKKIKGDEPEILFDDETVLLEVARKTPLEGKLLKFVEQKFRKKK